MLNHHLLNYSYLMLAVPSYVVPLYMKSTSEILSLPDVKLTPCEVRGSNG